MSACGAYDCDYCGLLVRAPLMPLRPFGSYVGPMPDTWFTLNGKTYCSRLCVRAALL